MKARIYRGFVGLVCLSLVLAMVTTVGATPVNAGSGSTPPSQGGRWLPFGAEAKPAPPTMTLLGADANAIDLQADTPGCMVEAVQAEGQTYTRLTGEGYGFAAKIGWPDLPVLRRDVEIPFGADVTLEVVKADYTDRSLADLGLSPIYPLQPPVPKTPGAQENRPFVKDLDFYAHGSRYPVAPVALGETYVVRGHRVQTVDVWPMAYDPAAGTVRLYRTITFRLRLAGSDMARTQAQAKRYASPAFESRLARQVLNYNQGRPAETFDSMTAVGYLIITADAYYSAMQPFVTLQTNRGFTVTMTKLSQIPGGSTNTAIKAYIQNAYDTWPVPPSYVLLVGDTDTVPGWDSVSANEVTDLYYGTMDGSSDWHPDLGRGRFPVRSTTQTTIMVNKYLAYANLTGQEAWLKKAAFPATCDNYTVAEGTHNYVINTYTLPKGYTGRFPNNPQPGGDKLYCITYSADTADIQAAVNEGRWMVIYSGHGGWDGWEMSYDQTQVRNLTNTGMLPFVASHACITGDFAQAEVFGETWVLQDSKGALVFWGSSDSSLWDQDDVLERVMFDSFFAAPNGHADVALMTDYGLAAVEAAYPGNARYYWETYNVLGDPSVKIFLQSERPTFTLGVDPTAHAICASGSVTSTVTIQSIRGYSQTVYLTTSPLPTGIIATLNPASAPAPFTSTLTLNVQTGAPAGDYTIVITATDYISTTLKDTVSLRVAAAVPAAPALTSPADGATNQPLLPTFTWGAVSSVDSYRFQLDDDPLFGTPLVDANTASTSYTPAAPLEGGHCYWWRVQGENVCGTGAWATPARFSTVSLIIAFSDDVEAGTGKWTHGAAQGTDHWATTTTQSHSPTHSWFVPDDSVVTDSRLWNTTPIALGSGSSTLTFWHRYNFEGTSYDGAVLEISTDGGSTWADLGVRITANGYNGTISSSYQNPLGGRSAWTGDLTSWTKVEVNLSSFAGQTAQIRWRLGCDSSQSDTGWYIDDVQVITTPPPNDFSHDPCPFVGVPVHFTATATGAYTYTWDFGGPGSGTGLDTATPVFTYTAPGNYVVELNLASACTTETITHEVSVCGQTVQGLDFAVSPNPRSNAVVTFTATATGTAPIVYTWDFGDGQTGSGPVATHTYLAGGSYTVTVNASNCAGCGSTQAMHSVAVCDSVHNVDFAVSRAPALLNQVVTFTASALGAAPIAYAWDFGDGHAGAGATVAHVYTATGSFNVSLAAANCVDAQATAQRSVTVCDPVHDVVLTPPVSLRSGVYQTFTASAAGTLPVAYAWTFGDGGTANGSNVSHRYNAGGTYTVTVTASNCGGAQTRVATGVFVCDSVHGANFSLSADPAPVSQTVTFTASAIGTAPLVYTWNFGDGQTGIGIEVTHVYTATGDYPVTLTVANCGDAQATVVRTVHVAEYKVYLPLVMKGS